MRRLLQIIRADLRPDTERGRLVRSTGMTAGMKIASISIAFLMSLIYARVMGPHGFGLYAYVTAAAALVALPTSLGIPSYLTREAAKTPGSAESMRHWADRRIVATGLLAAMLLCIAAVVPQAGNARWLFVVASPIPLLVNLSAIRQAELKALDHVVASQWPPLLLLPTLTLVCVAAIWIVRSTITPLDAIFATLAATAISFTTLHVRIHRLRIPIAIEDESHKLNVRRALPFLWLGAMYLVISRADLMLLGMISGPREAGIYAVASRAAELVGFILVAANTTLAPRVANLYHTGNTDQLQRMLEQATRRAFAASIPIASIFILGADPLIRIFYGTEYSSGAAALRILATSMLIVIATGPVGTILNMTGHERVSSKNIIPTVATNLLLNVVLIPMFGVTGAAVATGFSLVMRNITLLFWVRKLLGLRPSVLGY